MFPLSLGCSGAENAEHGTNRISATPPPPSQNDSVCSPSHHIHHQKRGDI